MAADPLAVSGPLPFARVTSVVKTLLSEGTLTRRGFGVWLVSLLFLRFLLFQAHASINLVMEGNRTASIYQFVAWFVAFRVASRSDRDAPLGAWEAITAVTCLILCALPGDMAVWIAATFAAAYFLLRAGGDVFYSSTGVLLLAMATNGFWARMLFRLVGLWLLKFDAFLVASTLALTGQLTAHHGTQIVVGQGHIELFEPCSSFTNISMALLIWVTMTKYVRPTWQKGDAWVGAICVAAVVLWNTLRLYMLAIYATNEAAFAFWHRGTGSIIIATLVSFAIGLIAVAAAMRQPA